jgi:hypothetical protein
MDINYKLVVPGYYSAWITCLLPEYEGRIVAALVKKGYSVGPIAKDIPVCHMPIKDSLAALLVLTVYCGDETITADKLNRDLLYIMDQEKLFYYSCIVTEYSNNISYAGCNIQINKPSPPISAAIRKMN